MILGPFLYFSRTRGIFVVLFASFFIISRIFLYILGPFSMFSPGFRVENRQTSAQIRKKLWRPCGPKTITGGSSCQGVTTERARQGGGLTGPCQREGTIISSAVRPARRRSVLRDSRFPLCRSGLCARTAAPVFDTGRIGMPTGLMW